MRRIAQIAALIVVVGTATAAMSAASAGTKKAAAISPDAVVTWNTNAVGAVRASTPTKFQTDGMVYMAYVQAAVYDAVTKIDGRYEPYHAFAFAVAPDASVQAAVAAAAPVRRPAEAASSSELPPPLRSSAKLWACRYLIRPWRPPGIPSGPTWLDAPPAPRWHSNRAAWR